jgi:hypothetical protein
VAVGEPAMSCMMGSIPEVGRPYSGVARICGQAIRVRIAEEYFNCWSKGLFCNDTSRANMCPLAMAQIGMSTD